MCGFIAQLVEQRTGNAEVTGSNPVEALIFFFRLLLFNCLNWKIDCADHSSLSSTTAVQKSIISFILHIIVVGTLHKKGRGKTGRELSEKPGGGEKKKHFLSLGAARFSHPVHY